MYLKNTYVPERYGVVDFAGIDQCYVLEATLYYKKPYLNMNNVKQWGRLVWWSIRKWNVLRGIMYP